MKHIHLISIGGAVMHNIALELARKGYKVTGSDDEIYDPSRSRLEKEGLLPDKMGWDADRISPEIDEIILGMHARDDNPEIKRAKELNIPMLSFPEFIYNLARDKTRVVIAGSHGKTSTTSMIMHALKEAHIDFDYLVGGQIEGFDLMVRFSDAPIIILEGDEYLSSALDKRPKMHHYKAHIAVITGIAWDHMNVFPSYDNYREQFDVFLEKCEKDAKVFCCANDEEVVSLMDRNLQAECELIPYTMIEDDEMDKMRIFGKHNQANLKAAELVCTELGLGSTDFFKYLSTFEGTAKRLQHIVKKRDLDVYFDFAHAPSKLKATVEAVRDKYPDRKFFAFYELHTYSSLNKEFIKQYEGSMDPADTAVVFYNAHTLKMKKMPELSANFVQESFGNEYIQIFTERKYLESFIEQQQKENAVYLFMTSGNFAKLDIQSFF